MKRLPALLCHGRRGFSSAAGDTPSPAEPGRHAHPRNDLLEQISHATTGQGHDLAARFALQESVAAAACDAAGPRKDRLTPWEVCGVCGLAKAMLTSQEGRRMVGGRARAHASLVRLSGLLNAWFGRHDKAFGEAMTLRIQRRDARGKWAIEAAQRLRAECEKDAFIAPVHCAAIACRLVWLQREKLNPVFRGLARVMSFWIATGGGGTQTVRLTHMTEMLHACVGQGALKDEATRNDFANLVRLAASHFYKVQHGTCTLPPHASIYDVSAVFLAGLDTHLLTGALRDFALREAEALYTRFPAGLDFGEVHLVAVQIRKRTRVDLAPFLTNLAAIHLAGKRAVPKYRDARSVDSIVRYVPRIVALCLELAAAAEQAADASDLRVAARQACRFMLAVLLDRQRTVDMRGVHAYAAAALPRHRVPAVLPQRSARGYFAFVPAGVAAPPLRTPPCAPLYTRQSVADLKRVAAACVAAGLHEVRLTRAALRRTQRVVRTRGVVAAMQLLAAVVDGRHGLKVSTSRGPRAFGRVILAKRMMRRCGPVVAPPQAFLQGGVTRWMALQSPHTAAAAAFTAATGVQTLLIRWLEELRLRLAASAGVAWGSELLADFLHLFDTALLVDYRWLSENDTSRPRETRSWCASTQAVTEAASWVRKRQPDLCSTAALCVRVGQATAQLARTGECLGKGGSRPRGRFTPYEAALITGPFSDAVWVAAPEASAAAATAPSDDGASAVRRELHPLPLSPPAVARAARWLVLLDALHDGTAQPRTKPSLQDAPLRTESAEEVPEGWGARVVDECFAGRGFALEGSQKEEVAAKLARGMSSVRHILTRGRTGDGAADAASTKTDVDAPLKSQVRKLLLVAQCVAHRTEHGVFVTAAQRALEGVGADAAASGGRELVRGVADLVAFCTQAHRSITPQPDLAGLTGAASVLRSAAHDPQLCAEDLVLYLRACAGLRILAGDAEPCVSEDVESAAVAAILSSGSLAASALEHGAFWFRDSPRVLDALSVAAVSREWTDDARLSEGVRALRLFSTLRYLPSNSLRLTQDVYEPLTRFLAGRKSGQHLLLRSILYQWCQFAGL
eukprot:Rhum_TRINITY_DN15911_c0_g1::Rhum_TRINITY_DN15911_c0_g1_i1::g.162426::m.162426